mmetsp:Transcript_20651/g.43962  ORF Transcript_20651/g.43962 Transcript_20651/m.43962 type:complete len:287 (-) Transcript_20651:60-920(-)
MIATAAGSVFVLLPLSMALQRHVSDMWPDGRTSGAYPSRKIATGRSKVQSMDEANLTCNDITFYGAGVPKIQQSFVTACSALKRNSSRKTFNFNFQGSLFGSGMVRRGYRDWVAPFASAMFADNDMFIITDAPANYTPLEPYDHTHERKTYRPKDHPHNHLMPFDAAYYQTMVDSNFTLCPGGDHPWSMRFHEAILAGSIPVIDSVSTDLSDHTVAFWVTRIGYRYFTTKEMLDLTLSSVELKSIVDHNYDLLMRYQTWLEGDLVPPAYAAYRNRCLSYSKCAKLC